MKRTTSRYPIYASTLAILAGTPAALQAQSADALIDKLVQKGILTVKEATDLRAETDKNFSQAFSVKSGMPDWVTALKFNGDFRGRFEQNNAESKTYIERNRYRYRIRLGITATLVDDFDIGLRLASGNPLTPTGGGLNGNPGGSPITANQDLNSLDSRKFIWIDAAYARWTPVHNAHWNVSGTIGKMDNPFTLSNMLWDYDIAPEGAALQLAYSPNEKHTLKFNGAFNVLDEINQAVTGLPLVGGTTPTGGPSHDPYILGAQTLWEAKWTETFETSLGLAAFAINNRDTLSAKVQPVYNLGNSRDPVNSLLRYNMNPIVGTGSITYKLASFPYYDGIFPIKASGEYLENPGAPVNNRGYRLGLTLGKAGKKGTWEVNYRYQRLEADAWFDAMVDDDNGAFYSAGNPQLAGTGKANGWFGGTNVKGHLVQATYSLRDYLNFTFTYYMNDLVIETPGLSSTAGHFMADLMWKF